MMSKLFKKVIAVTLIICFVFAFTGCKKTDKTDKKEAKTTEDTTVAKINPLTGKDGLSDSAVGKRPMAVVVENAPAARPQWGLGSADITIEGLVEGGITRMLWLYSDVSSIPKVGPTRSARIDFVEMAEGFDAIYVHFGGAATAYAAMQSRGTDDIDGNGQGNLKGTAQYFKRDTSRSSRGTEHTAYTTGEWLTNAISGTGVRADIKDSYKTPFAFNEKATPLTGGSCTSVTLSFSQSYNHTFKYNSQDNLYYNYMNSSEMVDENGNQMGVTNVIILYFPSYSMISGTKGSIDMDLSGGTGVVISNGTYQNINWTKGGPSDMLKITDEGGKEFKLNQGKSYIGLVPAANKNATNIVGDSAQ